MKRELLRNRAYDALKELIVEGDLEPGTFLSERQLAADFGMSKTPIRTALERLDLERFVTISPQQGIVVRELSLQEITDHYDIRVALESFVVRRLAGRLAHEQVLTLREHVEKLRACLVEVNRREFMHCDAEFHLLLCEYFGNAEITRVMAHQRAKLYRVILRQMARNPDRPGDTVSEHAQIVDALELGDAQGAVSAMEAHLNRGKLLLIMG